MITSLGTVNVTTSLGINKQRRWTLDLIHVTSIEIRYNFG